MAASYPTSVKAFTTKASAQTIQPAHVNDLQDEVTAIETALLTSGFAHAVTITAGAGGAALTIPATGRIYLDGGGDTYLFESAGNTVSCVVGGTSVLALTATAVTTTQDLVLAAVKRLYLDGGTNTFIDESSADNLRFVAGGNANLTVNATTITINGQTVAFGANGSGGTGYRAVVVPNA